MHWHTRHYPVSTHRHTVVVLVLGLVLAVVQGQGVCCQLRRRCTRERSQQG